MADTDETLTDVERGNPNTPEQLRQAREDAKAARADRDRYRREYDGLKAAFDKAQNDHSKVLESTRAEAAQQVEALRAELTGKVTAAEQALSENRTATSARVLRAELRAQAVAHGMRDPDDLGALDVSQAKLTDDGKVILPDGFFEKVKETKPYLFGTAPATTTSSTAKVPSPEPAETKQFKDMTAAEQAAWKRAHLR